MFNNLPRVYLDACCFIEAIAWERGKGNPDRKDDIWFIGKLFTAAIDGKVEILTSTLSIAECTHIEGALDEEIKQGFRRLLTSGQYVLLIQDTVLVAEHARSLRWVHEVNLRGPDSVHVASAISEGCGEFWTFDGKIPKFTQRLEALGLSVLGEGAMKRTRELPSEYRQHTIDEQDAKKERTDAQTAEVQGGGSGPFEGQAPAETEARGEDSKEEATR